LFWRNARTLSLRGERKMQEGRGSETLTWKSWRAGITKRWKLPVASKEGSKVIFPRRRLKKKVNDSRKRADFCFEEGGGGVAAREVRSPLDP